MSAEKPIRRIAKTAGPLVVAAALALAVALPVSHAATSKLERGFAEMHQREQVECEAKGGTYTPKSLLEYGTQCVSEEGYYLALEAYGKGD